MYPTVARQPAVQPQSPQEAIDAMLARLVPVSTHRVTLSCASGCVLAETVMTDRPSPAVDVSAMDGFAVRFEDIAPSGELPIAQDARIGRQPPSLAPMQAIRIVTGGPIPPGADTVIRREDVLEHEDRIELPEALLQKCSIGANVRRQAENAAAGTAIASPGTMITAALAGALATVGCASPLVHRPVKVGILITGDEVMAIDAALSPYQLRDSNGPALATLLAGAPWLSVIEHRRVGDDRAALRDAVDDLLGQCDALLLTGGVSMGNRDFVPTVLEEAGAQNVFHRVPQRPGRPMLGAVGPDGQAVFGLPGNPVSVLVTARRIAIAVLRHLAGFTAPEHRPSIMLDHRDDATLDMWWHRPVRLAASGMCRLVQGRGSGDIIAASQSDGFVEIPPNAAGCGPWPFHSWNL